MSEEVEYALVFGVATENSLAWRIARQLRSGGAKVAFAFQSESMGRKMKAMGEELGADFWLPCDLTSESQMDFVFEETKGRWGRLDCLVHSVAYAAPDALGKRFLETSREGFHRTMEVSAYSLVSLARRAEPLMSERGGSILTITASGSRKVVPGYHTMGVAKAALEASVRYLAWDLGPRKIRVNAISAGPVRTLAAVSIPAFPAILEAMRERSPLGETIEGDDVGRAAAFLCGPGGRHITGTIVHVDAGAHILGA